MNYSDISLVPRIISTISSRDEIDTSIDFCGVKLQIPIIASPMVDVCDGRVAKKMRDAGGYGIIHRFCSINEQIIEFEIANKEAGCAIGLDEIERFETLYDIGCRIFVIDTANAGNKNVLNFLSIIDYNKKIKKYKDDYYIIVGNVAAGEIYKEVASWVGVSGVRLMIGSGTACLTTNSTGIYNGSFSLLFECRSHDLHLPTLSKNILKIFDGGIKEPQDYCKSIALGSSCIMLGSLIASRKDSCAEKINSSYVKYRGSASFEIQKLYKKTPKYIEGYEKILKIENETIKEMLTRFNEGLISSMSYFNARNIHEYQKNISWIKI